MDPQVQGSFIPKAALTGDAAAGRFGLFFLIALLFFAMSLVAAGAVFAYQNILKKGIGDKSQELVEAQGAFQPSAIEALVRLDARMRQTKSLLQRHVAPSAIFVLLSEATLEKVQFTSFEYALESDGSAKIGLAGIASSFSTVALQSDQFGATKVLKDVIFSAISVESGGRVSFRVDARIDPSLIIYTRSLTTTPPVQTP